MPLSDADTNELLRRWHAGDRGALESLLVAELPWIREVVHARLGKRLRARAESGDLVQEAAIACLEYGPRFLVASRAQFRALLARIVENVIRDEHDWFNAGRRSMAREEPLRAGSVLRLDASLERSPTPSAAAAAGEWRDTVELAVQLLRPEDREAVILRDWQGLAFAEIGARRGVSEDAARMRYHRALARLGDIVRRLRRGELGDVDEPASAGA